MSDEKSVSITVLPFQEDITREAIVFGYGKSGTASTFPFREMGVPPSDVDKRIIGARRNWDRSCVDTCGTSESQKVTHCAASRPIDRV